MRWATTTGTSEGRRFVRVRVVLTLAVTCTVTLATGCAAGSDPAEATTVPHVVDLAYGDAQEALASRGLRWRQEGTDHVFDEPTSGWSTADDDLIVSQDPPAGARVERGSVVTLEISCAPPDDPSARCID